MKNDLNSKKKNEEKINLKKFELNSHTHKYQIYFINQSKCPVKNVG